MAVFHSCFRSSSSRRVFFVGVACGCCAGVACRCAGVSKSWASCGCVAVCCVADI